jgi:hypothetical protein
MCDVPTIAVFCSESIERFPGTASKFFLKLLVTTPVALMITGIIIIITTTIIIIIIIGGKQWQTTPKNLPRLQHTRVIPVA